MSGAKFTFSSISPYVASYLHYNGNPSIFPEDLYFLMPCSDLLLNIFNIFGLKIGELIGPKNAIILSLFFEFSSLSILLFIPKYIMILISMGIFGIGISINNLIITKNCWKYFPNNKGIVNGVIMMASGISTSFYTPIADFGIINPEKNGTYSNGLYSEEIANRFPNYIYVLFGIFFVFGSISFFFTFNYDEKIDNENNITENINEEKIVEDTIVEEKKEENLEKENEKIENDLKEGNENIEKNDDCNNNKTKITTRELLSLFFSRKNAHILAISIGGPCK